ARVRLPLPANAPCTTIISTCTDQSAIIKKSSAYATAPAVQTAVANMDTAVTNLQGTNAELVDARALVATLEAKQEAQIVTVRLTHEGVETALNTASNGDPVAAKAWVGAIQERAKPLAIGTTNGPPEKAMVRNVKRHAGMVEASCAPEKSVVGYAF